MDRLEFQAALKAKKYAAKDALEKNSFDMDTGSNNPIVTGM